MLSDLYHDIVMIDYDRAGKNQHPVAKRHVRDRIFMHLWAMEVFDRIDSIQLYWWSANPFEAWSPELKEVGC